MKTLLGSMFPSIYRKSLNAESEARLTYRRNEERLPRFNSNGISRLSLFHPLPLGFPTTHYDSSRTLSETIPIYGIHIDHYRIFDLLLVSC